MYSIEISFNCMVASFLMPKHRAVHGFYVYSKAF